MTRSIAITVNGQARDIAPGDTVAALLPDLSALRGETPHPGGTLFVGHSESLSAIDHGLRPLGAATYAKP